MDLNTYCAWGGEGESVLYNNMVYRTRLLVGAQALPVQAHLDYKYMPLKLACILIETMLNSKMC